MFIDGALVMGNGGFSMRSRKLLDLMKSDPEIALEKTPTHVFSENEDFVICVQKRAYLEGKGIRFAPLEVARRFSFEKNEKYGDMWDGQFGFHGLRWTDISNWLAAYPEYRGKIINDLRKDQQAGIRD